MNRSTPGLPVHHQFPESTQTHVHWVGGAIQPSHLLSSPSPPALNLPSIRVFSNESTLHMRWPMYWSFSFSISPSNEHPGLISFRMDWLDLHAVQGTLKSFLQHHSSKASVLWCSAFFTVQISHPYMTTGKTIALTRWTFVGKGMSLLFNMPSRLVITFLPRTSVQLLSRVWLFATPWIAARQASLSITISRSLLKLTSIKSGMPSSHLILCHPLLLLPPIPPSIRVFSNESTLHMRWPKYWSFSFSISPSKEHPGLISFRMDWSDLLAVQRTLKSLLQHHSSKASILWHSAFFIVQLSHPYMTTGKTIALTRRTFVGKVMSLLLNMLSRLVITFHPRSKRLLISCLQAVLGFIQFSSLYQLPQTNGPEVVFSHLHVFVWPTQF